MSVIYLENTGKLYPGLLSSHSGPPVVQIVYKIITRDSEMKGDILEDFTDVQINIKSNSVIAVLKVEIGHKYLQRT